MDSGCVAIRKQSQGLSLNNWSHENTTKITCFRDTSLKALYLHGRTAFERVGSRNRKQTSYLENLYCCPHVAIVSRTDFGGWGESTVKLLLKISAIVQHMGVSFVTLRSTRFNLQNNTFILRKVVESQCDGL